MAVCPGGAVCRARFDLQRILTARFVLMTEPMTEMLSVGDLHVVEYDRKTDPSQIEQVWRSLLERCEHDYFLSWGWISNWLDSLPQTVEVRLVVGYVRDQPALAFFLGAGSRRKYGILPTRTISLNTTGLRSFDQLYIEYNSVLHLPGLQFDMPSLLGMLGGRVWHEFGLPGLSAPFAKQAGLLDGKNIPHVGVLLEEESPSFYVDLQKVRAANMDYLQLLSSNKRSQIRRSVKEYQKDGEIQLEAAQTVAQALEMFAILVDLHQQEWRKRGKPGVFANPYLLEFHRSLIASRFESGETQLLKVSTPAAAIGYLYNFVYHRKVLFYQSGLNYLPGNLYRPGLVSHLQAILYNAHSDNQVYDFMAGEAGYKSSLATDSQPMYWMRLIKGSWRYAAEMRILRLKERLKNNPAFLERIKQVRDRLSPSSKPDPV